MNILVCGGFLGSGKTTLINRILHGITDQGQTVALIENEVCNDGIDAALTAQRDIRIIPLFGGCVCCQLSGDLLTAVNRLEDELRLDWAVVELTGLAMMNAIRDTFQRYGRPGQAERLHTITVLDMARLSEKFLTRMEPVLRGQLTGADAVVISKTDLAPVTDRAMACIRELAPDAAILPLSAVDLTPQEVWSGLGEVLL